GGRDHGLLSRLSFIAHRRRASGLPPPPPARGGEPRRTLRQVRRHPEGASHASAGPRAAGVQRVPRPAPAPAAVRPPLLRAPPPAHRFRQSTLGVRFVCRSFHFAAGGFTSAGIRCHSRRREEAMPIADRTESGFLILADISGFTAFVTATELEHGAEVTGVLLDGVMAALAPPFEIQELEGDAVFALVSDEAQTAAQRALLESFNRAFAAFSERQREIALDMSCSCRACRGVLGLSLKLIVHHGSFMRQVVRGRSRVAGPDIILAHRFLKNDVEPRTYVLFT